MVQRPGREGLVRLLPSTWKTAFGPPPTSCERLLQLPEGANLGRAVNDAMRAVEQENEDLRGVLSSNVSDKHP